VKGPVRTRRQVHVVGADGRLHLVDADAAGSELARIELRAHGVLLRAVNLDLGHAFDAEMRSAINSSPAVLVELVQRHVFGRDGEVGTGVSAGLTLLYDGGRGMFGGNWRPAAAMAACTSWRRRRDCG